MNGKFEYDPESLVAFCRKWAITEFCFFGSVLRDDFHTGSDIDVLISFADDSHWTLLDLVRMERELAALFGRNVDLVIRESVQRSENPRRKREILNSAQCVYAA